MNRKQRVIWSDNGTLKDVSAELNDYRRGTYVLDLATVDYLYVGSELPFNHKYFDVSVANAVAANITVETWNGSAWVAAVDVSDETKASGGSATLAQSGLVTWSPDVDKANWGCMRDSDDVDGLEGTRIFNLYWARFKVSANLTGTTALAYVGQRFSDDTDLTDFYPLLSSSALKAGYGVSDWKYPSFAAAEAIVADLRADEVVIRRDQILDVSLFKMASVHKTAAIIFGGLTGQAENEKRADEKYRKALSLKYFEVDTDGDGQATAAEKTMTTGFARR